MFVNAGGNGGAQQRQQRSLNSPGMTRQNSFPGPAGEGGVFPSPPSPNQGPQAFGGAGMMVGGPGGGAANVMFNPQTGQQQMQRVQRQPSIPQGAQHLPGEHIMTRGCLGGRYWGGGLLQRNKTLSLRELENKVPRNVVLSLADYRPNYRTM